MNRGKLVIVVMFTVSAGMAGFALWFQYNAGKNCMKYWGAESAERIQNATRVHLVALTHPSDGSQVATPLVEGAGSSATTIPLGNDELMLNSVRYTITREREISARPGLKHLQRALVEDRTFDWDSDRRDTRPNWNYLLVFTNQTGQSTVAVDLTGALMRKVGDEAESSRNLDAVRIDKFLRYFFESEE
ncbi:MAG: hypothetical protein ABGX07_02155 [Pirellulaceae bacterium]